jgi:hypothetical protein
MTHIKKNVQGPRWQYAIAMGLMTPGLSGCVQIATPDKPIEINLNINIRQEVVFRLDGKAKELVEQNSEIF